jgi:hypothetical protein
VLCGAVVSRGLLLAAWLAAIGWFASQGWTMAPSRMGAMAQVCFLALAAMLGALWWLAASALWVALVTEASQGHDRLHAPPTANFLDWFDEALYCSMALAAGCGGAWLVRQFVPGGGFAGAYGSWLAGLCCFAAALLSALEQGSPLGVVSGRLLSSIVQRPRAWLRFVAQSALIAGAAAGLAWRGLDGVLLAAPAATALSLVYAERVGSLGWRLAESVDKQEEPGAAGSR